MDTLTIRQKLFDYICYADDKKVEAIYAMIEGEIKEEYDIWGDKEFLEELDKRSADLDEGKVKGCSWEDVKTAAQQQLKQKRGR